MLSKKKSEPQGPLFFFCSLECWGQAPVLSYLVPGPDPSTKFLPAVEENLPPIILRAHREVNPIRGAALLQYQFIKVALRAIGDIQQYARHADHVFRAIASDIHCAARQVITPFRTPAFPIHLFTPIPARNNNRDIPIISPYSFSPYSFSPIPFSPIPIQHVVRISEILQPVLADVLQILNRHPTRDVSIRCIIARLC